MRSELTIAMIPSSTCAAERRDACAISPSAKKTVRLNQFGAIVLNGRIVIMDMGLATRRGDRPVGAGSMDCTRIAEDLRSLARIIHECRREAFETEARRGFSQVRPT